MTDRTIAGDARLLSPSVLPDADTRLDLAWTVNDVLHHVPRAVAVFNAFGVDACCGGARTLREAARAAHLDPAALLEAVVAVAWPDDEPRVRVAGAEGAP